MDPELLWRVKAMRPQVQAPPSQIALLAARPGLRFITGFCLSCGNPVPTPSAKEPSVLTRCTLCREAVAIVIQESGDPL